VLKADHLVLQLVTHCAGRVRPPTSKDRDATSRTIRGATAFLLSSAGWSGTAIAEALGRSDNYTTDVQARVRVEARIGAGPTLDLLLVVIEQLARTSTSTQQQERPSPCGPNIGGCSSDDTACIPSPAPGIRPKHRSWRERCDTAMARGYRPRLSVVEPRRECPARRSTCGRTDCRHHMGPDSPHPCVLELAMHGPLQFNVIGEILGGITRSRVQQLEVRALAKLRARGIVLDLPEERGLTHAEQAELAAPGRIEMSLRGSPEDWRR
jgi:hypothetical protein